MPKRKRNETAAAGQQPLRRSARLIEKRQNELAQAQAQQNNNQVANNQVPQQPQQPQQQPQQVQQQQAQGQAQGQVQPQPQPQGQQQQHQQQVHQQLQQQQHAQQQAQQQVQQQDQGQAQQPLPQPQLQQPPLNPPPQAAPGPQLPQDVQIRLQNKIKRAKNSPGIQHWMAHNRWPQRPAAERYGQVDPQLLPLLKQSRGSVQARAAADADWEVEEERARSPERDEADYTVANCTAILKKYRILTRDRQAGVPTKVRTLCADLRAKDAELPKHTVFELEPFLMTCERLLTKNNNGVNRLIGELLVPSAEMAIDRGLTQFQHFAVGMSEIWTLMSPLMDDGQEKLPIPQPDYAVGFSEEAFTEEQLEKLEPYSGPESFFRPTATMNFPFLTTEIKARQLLDMADVENTYSAALAVGGVVALFRIVGREEELHKEVLAFSISHSHRIVRIYAHYVMFDNGAVSYYLHLVHEYTLTPRDIRQRWVSYKFVMAVYNEWAPVHHARICSAIDDLPDPLEQNTSASDPESPTESSEE